MTAITDEPAVVQHAVAEAEVEVSQETLSAIVDGVIDKGDVLSVAELAGVMAGKRAADLIPLVHPAGLTQLVVNATPDRAASAVKIRTETAALGQAGVEMEALTAAAVAALTVYDMVRDLEPGAAIRSLRLISRSSGETEEWRRSSGPGEAQRIQKGARVAGRIVPGSRGPQAYRPSPRRHAP
jgi:cyclic pyranopterin monophosphate synthase